MNRVLLYILLTFTSNVFANSTLDSLINTLDQVILNNEKFDSRKNEQIAKLKELKNVNDISFEQAYYLNNKLALEYEKYVFDSSLHYLKQNLNVCKNLDEPKFLIKTKLIMANLLASSGRYKESTDVLHSIERHYVSDELIQEYYKVFMKVYSVLGFNSLVDENREKYYQTYSTYTDSLLQFVGKHSIEYYSIMETKLRDSRKLDECLHVNDKRLALISDDSKDYSLITFERALTYDLQKDTINAKKFFALSAISDISSSIKDNASLASLARMFYNEQKVEKAHQYIDYSYKDAFFYNSKLRFAQISNLLPIIEDAYLLKSTKQQNLIKISLLVISILSVGLIVAIVVVYNQMKKVSKTRNSYKNANVKLNEANENLQQANSKLSTLYSELSEANKVKEHYIGNFLSICSNYIDKLDKYRRMVAKNLNDKNISELHKRVKSTQIIDAEILEFYNNFDSTFLHIYPNFVDRLNALLSKDEHIIIKKGDLLNTELRIFALVRLGVNDSKKIASLLRYSVRTIYNYRVKIKNKAIVPRDDFEKCIMKIGVMS